MNDDKTYTGTGSSIIAIVKEDNKLKSVEIRRDNGSFDLLWTRSSEGESTDWEAFAAECGLSSGSNTRADGYDDRAVVVGFNSVGTVFHRTMVPAVGQREIASIVALQAETRLPLSAEQIELAWRAGHAQDGQTSVTLAVARKENLRAFVENVRPLKPARILLDCEGIVEAWKMVFAGVEKKAVILSAAEHNTHICLIEDGRLSNTVVLDVGTDDFAAEGAGEQTEAIERFTQDVTSVLELFGCAEQPDMPVLVLSDGRAVHVSIVSSLRLTRLNARVAVPDLKRLAPGGQLGAEGLYDYRTPIGLALLGLEGRDDELNLFEHLYRPAGKEDKKSWLYSPKMACVLAAVMLVLLVLVSYGIDLATPSAIEKRLKASISDVDMDLLLKKQEMIKTVARERPDMLELLKLVNNSGGRGVTLDTLHFKKGQPVSVTGQAAHNEDLTQFEKNLQSQNAIGSVNPPTSNVNAKSRKITFTITFQYKNFTKKTATRAGGRAPTRLRP
jgi:Fimbrial assembly protein (PilN)